MRNILLLISVCVFMAGLAGCAAPPKVSVGRFTVGSNHNVRGLDYDLGAESKSAASVDGQSCYIWNDFFGYGTGDANDRVSKAIDNAIDNGRKKGIDGDMIANAVIDETYEVGLITRTWCVKVKGLLVRLKR